MWIAIQVVAAVIALGSIGSLVWIGNAFNRDRLTEKDRADGYYRMLEGIITRCGFVSGWDQCNAESAVEARMAELHETKEVLARVTAERDAALGTLERMREWRRQGEEMFSED